MSVFFWLYSPSEALSFCIVEAYYILFEKGRMACMADQTIVRPVPLQDRIQECRLPSMHQEGFEAATQDTSNQRP
jgi:hypothetical protein